MKLVDLDARFYGEGDRQGLGILFECPVHPGGACMTGAPFANPLDGGPPRPQPNGCAWQRTGTTIDTLTLSPSIDGSHHKGPDGTPCWHGHVTNGEIVGGLR